MYESDVDGDRTVLCASWHQLPGVRALEAEITELAAHLQAATYRLLELIRVFDECKGWAGPGLRSCAHWLNWKCGIGLNAAREKVRVAHALPALPKIRAAFRQGRISYAKVRAMTRVATPENEDYLLMIARHGTAAQVERLVRLYRRVRREEALRKENHRFATREATWHEDDDGCFVIRARLPREAGQRVIAAIEAAMEETYREQQDVPSDDAQRTKLDWQLREGMAARRADGLARVAEGYLAGNAGSNGGDRYTINVHVDLETLKADGEGAEAEIEGAGNVSAETSRRLSCDAGILRWLEDGDGEPLSVGRRTRSIPAAIRRALQRRDGGCRFPGCHATRFIDAHHVRHWADGGETRLDNLILLCGYHHRLVHEGGYGVTMRAGRTARFTDPSGAIIPEVPEARFRGNLDSLIEGNRQAGLTITPTTGIPYWLGERMDYVAGVESLLRRE